QGVRRLERLYPTSFDADKTWVLYNKVLPEIAASMGQLLRIERRLTPLPWDIDVVRDYVAGRLPVHMDAPNAFTLAILEGIELALGRAVVEDIDAWRAGTASRLRGPISTRLADIDSQIDQLERVRIESQSAARASFSFSSRSSRLRLAISSVGLVLL